MAAPLVCTPVVYPLNLLSLFPLFRTFSKMPLLMCSDSVLFSVLPTYFVRHLHGLGVSISRRTFDSHPPRDNIPVARELGVRLTLGRARP
jgi:hypothetical protein